MATHPALRHGYGQYRYHAGGMETADVNPLGRKGVPGVGTRIRAARRRAGLTIQALADRAGVDNSSVTQWEGGGRDLFVRHLMTLATALGVPVESLLPDAPLPPPQVFAGSLECPRCRTECGVLVTALPSPLSRREGTGRSDG